MIVTSLVEFFEAQDELELVAKYPEKFSDNYLESNKNLRTTNSSQQSVPTDTDIKNQAKSTCST